MDDAYTLTVPLNACGGSFAAGSKMRGKVCFAILNPGSRRAFHDKQAHDVKRR
jgi:hypothetical protein